MATQAADRARSSPAPSVFAVVLLIAAWVAATFLAAGSFAWVRGWVYLVLTSGGLMLHRLFVGSRNPEVLKARQEIGAGTKSWDKGWNALFWPLMLTGPIVAALDSGRFHWSRMSWIGWPVGTAILAAGLAVSGWAMASNPFFEGTVRIQEERHHRVVDAGPYRFIRHPGYLGLSLWALSAPLLLGSWWALVPAGVTVVWIVLRTVLEDRTLKNELNGYQNYTTRVRFRLVPGLW